MFWSSEGYYFMRCTKAEATVLSGAVALHRAWSGIMARGLAMVTVEEPGIDELDAQLEQLRSQGEPRPLQLGREGLEALHGVIQESVEALQSYRRARSAARSQGQGLYGMLEDCFGENVRDPKVSKEIMGQLEALSQRIGLEAG